MKKEEGRHVVVVEVFNMAEKRVQKLKEKLTEAKRDKKTVEAALEGVERQAEGQ